MGEAIAVVGLVIATYATIDINIKHTNLLADGLASHRGLKDATQNLDDFRVKSANASLRQQLDLAHQLTRTSSDEEVKTNLSTSFEDIQKYVIEAGELLQKRSTVKSDYLVPAPRAWKKLKMLKTARDLFESIANTAANQNALASPLFL